MRRFREIKDFGLGRLPTRAIALQKIVILPTLVYFHPKGHLAEFLPVLWPNWGLFWDPFVVVL